MDCHAPGSRIATKSYQEKQLEREARCPEPLLTHYVSQMLGVSLDKGLSSAAGGGSAGRSGGFDAVVGKPDLEGSSLPPAQCLSSKNAVPGL